MLKISYSDIIYQDNTYYVVKIVLNDGTELHITINKENNNRNGIYVVR